MTKINLFRFGLRALAMTALCVGLATGAHADDPQSNTLPAPAARVVGVALQDGGVLHGQLLDTQGRPMAKQEVRILSQGRVVVAAETNAQGRFGVRGLRGGLHTIESKGTSQPVQLWAPQTAPPSANQVAVVVAGQEGVVRGQIIENTTTRAVVYGALGGAGTYWALDYNPNGS